MVSIQKSTMQKTALECLVFGSIACLANTRYCIQYMPNLPKNGALLSGGAFILSSSIYNILRADPERSLSQTLLEKQILFLAASSITMYAAKITPGQAAGLGLATWLFSACVERSFNIGKQTSPLEQPNTDISANIEKLTPSIVEKMSKSELESRINGIRENPIDWVNFSPEIQTAFLKGFIQEDINHIPLHTMPKDRSWVKLEEDSLSEITQNQARWYLNLYGIARPCFEANPFECENTNQLGKILRKCLTEYGYNSIIPIIDNNEQECGLDENVVKSLLSKGFKGSKPISEKSAKSVYEHIYNKALQKHHLVYIYSDKLTFEEELFLRNQFLEKVVFDLTPRYVEHLNKIKEELNAVTNCYAKMGANKPFARIEDLPKESQEKAKKIFGINDNPQQ